MAKHRTEEQIIEDKLKQIEYLKKKKEAKDALKNKITPKIEDEIIGDPLDLNILNRENVVEKEKTQEIITVNEPEKPKVEITSTVSEVERPLLEQGLQEIMQDSIPKGLNSVVVLLNAQDRVKINPPSPGMAALWAKFALPVIEKYFPGISKETAFLLISAGILTGMVEVKKGLPGKVKSDA